MGAWLKRNRWVAPYALLAPGLAGGWLFAAILTGPASFLAAPAALAQKWPSKPVTLIVPGAGGSSTDNIA